jgi:hypothetical protein
MKTITKAKAKSLIEKSNGAFFAAQFVKQDGEKRHIVARTGVTKYLNGGVLKFNPASRGHMVVFDVELKGYRMLNTRTLFRLKIGGRTYKVK